MKNVKLISFAFFMLNCFIATAQEEKKSSETKTVSQPFSKSKDTIAAVKVPSVNVQLSTPNNKVIICAPSKSSLLNPPLTILDGVIINAKQFSEINAKNIESVKVLKGVDATSLYGSQAVDGVIIMTTKK
ncbi:TonB-dependent receptor plug domain-containing protein [Flavobacterium sp. MC2016-06]|jgi:TonB-dependent SusC/RagA subfamily outer membrane receptor|uniref:TonB-dependent receptor plug domain-containing protein n=1 Tax=Flavobacterium sp. MC2016-06 TaxID=2676308 RepID=UPI0012BAEEA7|nr:TonB-dependent receptor plug domain-containing protein [Flavobacterium sp. MC2016-06]MBU3860196.1 TonB-dependent receptor plug domain-containing protein [Flavobacterium sp. MC2016-06]